MRRLMHVENIYYTLGDRTLFDISQLTIHEGDRIGLVGKNGQGKSLLLNYLVGKIEAKVKVEWQGTVGFLEQFSLHKQHNSLSGGEETLKKLEAIFSETYDLILLDEPTNNLDWKRIDELETKLNAFKGAYIIVSHDRELLDGVCTKIWELEEGKIKEYSGNYSNYKEAKSLEIRQQYEQHEAYVKEKQRLFSRMQQKSQQAQGMRKPPARMGNSEWQLYKNKAAGKQKKVERVTKVIKERIDRLERIDKPVEWDEIKMEVNPSSTIHRKTLLMAKNMTCNVKGRLLFNIPTLKLKTGSKTALLGDNGSGKTTLINTILSYDVQKDLAKNVKIGLFEQALNKLPREKILLDYVKEGSTIPEHIIRIILARLRFTASDVVKKIGVLSGGERVKTAIAKLLTGDFNLLILDEPTNHLDLEAIEALQALIRDYPGTVLFVSHDRRFVEETANKLWILENKTVTMFDGPLKEWREKQKSPKQLKDSDLELMTLETRLTEVIGRLSMPSPRDNLTLLEQNYEEILSEIKQIKSGS